MTEARSSEVGLSLQADFNRPGITGLKSGRSLKTLPQDAAKEFEAMLLQQMLQSAREVEDQEDSTGDTMWSLAAQQFAKVLADNGGVGIAKLVQESLK